VGESAAVMEVSVNGLRLRNPRGDVTAKLQPIDAWGFTEVPRRLQEELTAPICTSGAWSPMGLLALAEMYEVPGLVELIVAAMEQSINTENVMEIIRCLNKRKASKIIEPAIKRLRKRIHDYPILYEKVVDSL